MSEKKEEEMMTAVTIKLDNKWIVNVGSGFSLEERRKYYKHPEDIIGKEICVSYFEKTKNKKGGKSLRFPTKVHIYSEKRDV